MWTRPILATAGCGITVRLLISTLLAFCAVGCVKLSRVDPNDPPDLSGREALLAFDIDSDLPIRSISHR